MIGPPPRDKLVRRLTIPLSGFFFTRGAASGKLAASAGYATDRINAMQSRLTIP
jgi:hypothetical protein